MFPLTRSDGLALHGSLTLARPAQPQAARALVLLVHGLGEHEGRYGPLKRHLAAQGLAVAAYDQCGHGRSGGSRGALPAADALLADLGAVVADLATQASAAGLPLVILGHSMGGLVAARYVAEGLNPQPAPFWRPVHALVLSSPALALDMHPLLRRAVPVLARWAPGLALGNGLDPAGLSRDADVVRAYRADPLVHDRITPRLANFFLSASAVVQAAAPRWRVPTLLLYAGADRCVAPSGSAAFAAAAPAEVLKAIGYPGLAHEIFNEPEQDRVLADLDAWLSRAA